MSKELYCKLTCALTHSIETCNSCKKCNGDSGPEIRINLIKEMADESGYELPWRESDETN